MLIKDFNTKKENNNNFNLIGRVRVKVLVVAAVLAATLITAQLVFASNLATDGTKLSEITGEIAKLEAENTTLKAQIAQNTSLTSLSKKAQELGFEKPTKVIVP